MKLAKRNGLRKAKVAVARKLAVILHRRGSTEPSSTGRRNKLSRSAHKEITGFPRNSGIGRPAGDGGGGEIARFFAELSIRETALATLIDQRRLTPSCGGQVLTAERTVGPAMFAESLSQSDGLETQSGTNASPQCPHNGGYRGQSGISICST